MGRGANYAAQYAISGHAQSSLVAKATRQENRSKSFSNNAVGFMGAPRPYLRGTFQCNAAEAVAQIWREEGGTRLFGGARIRTRGENHMTGTTKHSPRTDLVELVAVSQGAPGEGVLSAPLASLSLLSVLSVSLASR